MNKSLKGFFSFLFAAGILTCLVILVFFDAIRMVVSKENIAASIQSIDVKEVLTANSEDYEKIINKYAGSTDILNNSALSSTNLTKNDIDNILNSEDYANILGSYIVDEDIFSGIPELEESSTEQYSTDSISREDIEGLLKEIDIDYTEDDVDYLLNSVPSVAPTIATEVDNSLNESFKNSVDNINLSKFYRIFSKRAMFYSWIGLIVCIIALCIILVKRFYFNVVLACCSGAMCIFSRILYAISKALLKHTPDTYKGAIEVFAKPLEKRFLFDYKLFLIATVAFVVIYYLLNITITRTSIGSSIEFLHHMYEDEEEQYNDNNDDEADIEDIMHLDPNSIKVIDIDKELDDMNYK